MWDIWHSIRTYATIQFKQQPRKSENKSPNHPQIWTLWIFIYLLCEAVTLKNEIILRFFCCSSHRFYVLSGNGVPRLTANYTVCVSVCASLYSSFRFGGLFAKRNNNQPVSQQTSQLTRADCKSTMENIQDTKVYKQIKWNLQRKTINNFRIYKNAVYIDIIYRFSFGSAEIWNTKQLRLLYGISGFIRILCVIFLRHSNHHKKKLNSKINILCAK